MINSSSKKQQANFFISVQIIQAMKETVPPREQSKFVEHAIEKELRRTQFLEALEASAGSWKKKDHRTSPDTFIRSLRESKRS